MESPIKENRSRRVAYLGLMISLAMIFSYVESLIPLPIPIPGIKIGLANLVVLYVLEEIGTKEAFTVSVLRILLLAFLFTNTAALLYSLAGGIVSFFIMAILKNSKSASVYFTSIMGAVFHNLAQLLVAGVVLHSMAVIGYLPALLVSGMITGAFISVVFVRIRKYLGVLKKTL